MTDRFANDTDDWRDRRGYDLSQRIWLNRIALRQHIDTMITEAVRTGQTAEEVADHLIRYVKPSYARSGAPGDGTARYAANRLAGNEMRRGHALATQATAMTDPAGGYLRYTVSPGHADPDECDGYAGHSEGFGRGVYPAKDTPLPPRHVSCRCFVTEIGIRTDDMNALVEQLRVEYDLADPPDLSPADLAIFRQQTAQVRQDVQILFRAWLDQVGLVSREQLVSSSPTVRQWVEQVLFEKMRRRR